MGRLVAFIFLRLWRRPKVNHSWLYTQMFHEEIKGKQQISN